MKRFRHPRGVWTCVSRDGTAPRWIRIGTVTYYPDGAEVIRLDALPVNATMHVSDDEPGAVVVSAPAEGSAR